MHLIMFLVVRANMYAQIEKLIKNAIEKYSLHKLIKIIEAGEAQINKIPVKKKWNNKWQRQSN